MGANRHRCTRYSFDMLAKFCTLKLYGVCSALAHKPTGIYHRVINRCLIRHKRHIAYNERIVRSASDCRRVMYHILHCHRQRVLIAEHNHAK